MAGANDFEMMLNNFLKSAENIITHFDDDKVVRNQLLDNLHVYVKKCCSNSLRVKKFSTAFREVFQNIDAENTNSDDIIKLFKEKKNEFLDYEPDVSQNSNFEEFSQQMKDLANSADGVKKRSAHEDDDIEMTQDDVNVIDPFTKKRMTDPLKNKVCGHIYDRESVVQMLKLNDKTRCPVVGCSNKESIDLNNMIPDFVTRKFLHDNPA
ncbi:E3 SUMO-protein ligase NSE2 [Copidosoma floridanum]|uniref:E3 SUMO-protein ligase NSE2 n=1 Tax=Copidosoma floridanum TaxID=29053 RepID=UPI0006C99226|nr:E3 SUMO-protein ligase NSE2 [Copidosoma floridanum]